MANPNSAPVAAPVEAAIQATPAPQGDIIHSLLVPPSNTESATSADTGEGGSSRVEKILKGEAVATAAELAMNLAGVNLGLREMVGTAIDMRTYAPEQEAEPTRMQKLKSAAGLLAINLATGYAVQKGASTAIEIVSDSLANTPVETVTQLVGKLGAMTGATTLLSKYTNR